MHLPNEESVRVVLFNRKNEILLQKISIVGKPEFFITPGGRVDAQDTNLLDTVLRELHEETGLDDIEMLDNEAFYSGSHVMQRTTGSVKLLEHFFAARYLGELAGINQDAQSLTREERDTFQTQSWMPVDMLNDNGIIALPVNLKSIAVAILNGEVVPDVDFSDPPEFR